MITTEKLHSLYKHCLEEEGINYHTFRHDTGKYINWLEDLLKSTNVMLNRLKPERRREDDPNR